MSKPEWLKTTATVYMSGSADGDETSVSRVLYSYVVNGEHQSGEFFSGHEYQAGDLFTLRYDPSNPAMTDRSVEYHRQVRNGRILKAIQLVFVIVMFYLFVHRQ